MRNFLAVIALTGLSAGCASVTSHVDGGGAAGMAGNVLLGGSMGAGVDAGSGAMHSHKPNPLVVTLTPLDPDTPAARKEETEAADIDAGAAQHHAASSE